MNFFQKVGSIWTANRKGLAKTAAAAGTFASTGNPLLAAGAYRAVGDALSRPGSTAVLVADVPAAAPTLAGQAPATALIGSQSVAASEAARAAGAQPVVAPMVFGLPRQTAVIAGGVLAALVVVVLIVLAMRRS